MNANETNVMDGIILRHPKTDFREVDEDIFLVHPDGVTIYNLNPTAAAIWRLMGEEMTGDEMAEIMSVVFVAIPPMRIKSDVENVLAELLNEGFAIKQ